jgi:hypothetical protein
MKFAWRKNSVTKIISGVWFGVLAAGVLFMGHLEAVDVSVTARVTVEQVFSISVDRDTIDFYNMKPGESRMDVPPTGIRVTTKSNTGNPWFLKIKAVEPLTSGRNAIPNENFKWYGWTEGSGTWYGTGKENLLATSMVTYASSLSEGLNADPGVANVFKFKLDVPQNQAAGSYESTVQFILTE